MSSSKATTPTVLSHPEPTVWVIKLSSPPDHRLRVPLLSSLTENLDQIEAEWRKSSGDRDKQGPGADRATWGEHNGAGAVIIVGDGRFFSNGFDLGDIFKDRSHVERNFDPVMYRLLTFPLVTIAAINGHAFAGGMMLALACDFRIMTSGKGMLSMNELSFGAPIPNSFAALLQLRLDPADVRDTMLGKRWLQKELLAKGVVDEVVDGSEVLSRAIEKGKQEGDKIAAGAWGIIKDTLYHTVIDASLSNRPSPMPAQKAKEFWARYRDVKAKL